MSGTIYLDFNASTPIDPEVARAMEPFLRDYFGNPSSMHEYGIQSKQAIDRARREVANLIGAYPYEIIFTAGGTESNNLAIQGAARALRHRGNHIITSQVEHPAVLEVCRFLEKEGFEVSYAPVDEFGCVDPDIIKKLLRKGTILVTIMHANNEVGSIQPVEEIGRLVKDHEILFHTDAAQSLGKIPVDVNNIQADMLSIAGHKLYAPKGVGALYLRQGVQIDRILFGADHEQNRRPGTENVLHIVGLGKACEIAGRDLPERALHMKTMRDRLHHVLADRIPGIRCHGHPELRLPNTLSIGFPGIEAQTLLSSLPGVAASAGAACHTDLDETSGVLSAMRVPNEYAMGTLRFSTGTTTTHEEVELAAGMIAEAVESLTGDKVHQNDIHKGKVRLTQYTHGLGCACKLRPQDLEKILQQIPGNTDPRILVGASDSDDAAVYRLRDDLAIVETVDFFTPVVDDPFWFGAIAAANSLSDIYAMGAQPLFALNVVGFPSRRLNLSVLQEILRGAHEKAAEAGIPVLGGHTIEDPEPKYGMVVTGEVHPAKIWTNTGARVGDILILTKPIGTGVYSTAIKRGLLNDELTAMACKLMARLNKSAAGVLKNFTVHACTDVSGFGLLGHLLEMTKGSGLKAIIRADRVPLLPDLLELIGSGIVPGGTLNNREFVREWLTGEGAGKELILTALCDAQTSGGLLAAIPEKESAAALESLKNAGISEAAIIGQMLEPGKGHIEIKTK